MHDKKSIGAVAEGQAPAPDKDLSPRLALALAQASLADPVEQAASFGRWWLDPQAAQLVLSIGAAEFLNVGVGRQQAIESCLQHVVAEDAPLLRTALTQAPPGLHGWLIDCEFRVVNELDGLRWLRMTSLPPAQAQSEVQAGVLVDITASKHAAMRERLSFESTQFLIGTHGLGEAVTKVIRLVCENLGWEWGAYWALEQDANGMQQLGCKHYWHHPEYALEALTQESRSMRMRPGEGLVGYVWNSGAPCWIEHLESDPAFLRRRSAAACKLRSGYVFPVAYVTADGRRHSPGVLEFFSTLSRQREAQLPNLSASIGALIAQTVQRLEQQECIRLLAQTDELTGLANRSHFHQKLETACFKATPAGDPFGLLYIDLDRFKPINDAFGHEAGNGVLQEFGQRLLQLAPPGCRVGRLGGDEFAILTSQGTSMAQLGALAEQVLLAASAPFQFEENELTVSASVGLSVFPENGWTAPELLRCADAAMYRSKKSGRNASSFFSGASSQTLALQQSSLMQQLTMETDLHHALVGNQFFLEYQPVFDSFSQRVVAVEALIRWRRPNGEIVRPDIFIPIAEKSRLIVQIGRWVVRQACRDLPLLQQAGFKDLQVNVNMAAPEFTNAGLPGELMAVVGAAGVAPHHLCLELTEGLVMKHPEKVIPVMSALRQLGFKIGLDDFGMGHSSLSRLKKLPISSLKIDRSFVSGLPHDRGDCAIVRTILELGRQMKLQVIAEGAETDAQLVYLRQFGCALVQGFVLSRPLPLAELIARHAPQPAPAGPG
jgi:diguanylate cyclase (GGDEF)-like protein